MSKFEQAKTDLLKELAKSNSDPRMLSSLSDALLDSAEGSVRFTVDAQHINRLGLELVGKQETALSELVKNAYDADATTVDVSFTNYDQPGGILVIRDNGSGMTAQTIRNTWMRLSTNDKGDNPVSPRFGRRRAGRKGIGRFAVQRLGKTLLLETGLKGDKEGIRVRFNWEGEFTAGTNLNQVWHEIETYPKDPETSGTTLNIQDLRDRWTEVAFDRVWKSILFLQPPFAASKKKDANIDEFSVRINGVNSGKRRIDLNLENSFLAHALAEITGTVDGSGVGTFKVKSDKLGMDETFVSDSKYFLTGPLELQTKYFIYLAETMSGISVRLAAEMGRAYGGVRVYRNGFRVLPYGEPHDDWLKLAEDAARRNVLVPANNFSFFGHVDLDSINNPLLEETSSREGFIENEAFAELQLFTRRCIEWAVLEVAAVRKRKTTASQPGFTSTAPNKPSEAIRQKLSEFKREAASEGSSVPEPDKPDEPKASPSDSSSTEKLLGELLEDAEAFEQDVNDRLNRSIEYESMLRILASLGISISIFGHEIKSATTGVDNSLALASIDTDELKDEAERALIHEDLGKIKSATDRIFDLGSYVEALISRTRSRALTRVHLNASVDRFVTQFKTYLQKRHIEFEVDIVPYDLMTPAMHASEFDSVLFNLLTNAAKAIDKAQPVKPKLKITGRDDGEFIVVGFQDNGTGVADKIKGRVFEPFFTTTEQDGDSISGIGTGLGLKIVADISSAYGGRASLLDQVDDGYSTHFEITFRK